MPLRGAPGPGLFSRARVCTPPNSGGKPQGSFAVECWSSRSPTPGAGVQQRGHGGRLPVRPGSEGRPGPSGGQLGAPSGWFGRSRGMKASSPSHKLDGQSCRGHCGWVLGAQGRSSGSRLRPGACPPRRWLRGSCLVPSAPMHEGADCPSPSRWGTHVAPARGTPRGGWALRGAGGHGPESQGWRNAESALARGGCRLSGEVEFGTEVTVLPETVRLMSQSVGGGPRPGGSAR